VTSILIVDDNEQNLYQLQVLLGGNGYRVVTAANGVEALGEARQNPPDLVVSDILMPVMDGFAFCREWKKDERLKAIPFVFYTATYTDDRDRHLALGLGADRFLVKPEEPEVIIRAIRDVLERTKPSPTAPTKPAAGEAGAQPAPSPPEDESVFLKLYNQTLIRKLDNKIQQLERANRELEQDITERMRAEKALRESEERFRQLAETMPDAVVVGQDGRNVYANSAAARLFRAAGPEELVGLDISAIVAPAQYDRAQQQMQRTLAGEMQPPFEDRFVRLDGSVVPVEIAASLLTWQGRPAIQVVVRDITERKRAEEALRESEEQYRTLVAHSPDGIFLVDLKGNFLSVNETICRKLGFSEAEMLAMSLWDIVPEGQWETHKARLARILKGESLDDTVEYNVRNKAAQLVPVEVRSAPYRKGEEIVGFQAIARDIAERKRVEQALRASEERYRLIAENTADVIWTLDLATRRLTYVSPSVERLRGFTAEEVLAQPFGASLTPDSLRRVDAQLAEALAAFAAGDQSAKTGTVEAEMPTKDGGTVRTEIVATALTDASRRVTGVLGVTRDITERKRAEDALRQSERRFQLLAHVAPVGIFETDVHGATVYVNRRWTEISGLSADEALGDGWLRAVHPEDRERIASGWSHASGAGRTSKAEYRFLRPDGTLAWVEGHASAVSDATGCVTGYVGTIMDITERKRAEAAMRESEERYRSLFEQSPLGIYRTTPDGRILDANPALLQMLGYASADELRSRNLEESGFQPEYLRETFKDTIEREGEVRASETVWTTKDGRRLHVRENAKPIRDAYGKILYYEGAVEDITQQKWSEEERRRLVAAIEQAAEAVVVTDSGGGILYVNPAFERITGYRADEVIGLNSRILKSGKQDPSFYAEMWTTITHGSVWIGRLCNRRKDGSLYEEEMSISPVRDENGTIINFVAVKRDVTHELELQQQLNQAQKMEAVGQLAGGVAHDFNNLLQAMLSLTQVLLAHRTDPERVAADAAELEQQVKHGAALTRQLLLFSRRETAQPETLDLNEVVREASKLLRRLLKATIAVKLRLTERKLPVEADRGQLEQVLFNLAVNAADAMPEGGELAIATGSDVSTVWFQVADTGGGIPAEIRQRIFEPFFTTKGEGRGTGLGLAVVHGIVAQHGGRIAFESREGQGTTFTITLPRADSGEFAAVKVTELAGEAPAGRGERVLIVEDEATARDTLAEIVTVLGYEVVAVGSGEEAGLLPPEPRFKVLLTDLMLPGIAGADLARGLLERWPELKVILMSGYTEDEAMRRGISAGPVHFLQKPFGMTTLARELRSVLDGVPAAGAGGNKP
jgi:PAS domain S-box-containing protein